MSAGTPEPGGVDVARLMSRIQGEVSARGAELAGQLAGIEREMRRLGQADLAAMASSQAAANEAFEAIEKESHKARQGGLNRVLDAAGRANETHEVAGRAEAGSGPGHIAAILERQQRANELVAQIERETARDADATGGGISLHDLARVPGAARPWTSPKRWIAALYRTVWRRQEAFNLEMVRRLDGERCAREQVYRLALQMLDSLNMIAPRLRAQQDLQERIHLLGGRWWRARTRW